MPSLLNISKTYRNLKKKTVREAATICPASCKADLWPWKYILIRLLVRIGFRQPSVMCSLLPYLEIKKMWQQIVTVTHNVYFQTQRISITMHIICVFAVGYGEKEYQKWHPVDRTHPPRPLIPQKLFVSK